MPSFTDFVPSELPRFLSLDKYLDDILQAFKQKDMNVFISPEELGLDHMSLYGKGKTAELQPIVKRFVNMQKQVKNLWETTLRNQDRVAKNVVEMQTVVYDVQSFYEHVITTREMFPQVDFVQSITLDLVNDCHQMSSDFKSFRSNYLSQLMPLLNYQKKVVNRWTAIVILIELMTIAIFAVGFLPSPDDLSGWSLFQYVFILVVSVLLLTVFIFKTLRYSSSLHIKISHFKDFVSEQIQLFIVSLPDSESKSISAEVHLMPKV